MTDKEANLLHILKQVNYSYQKLTDNEDYHRIFSGMLEELVHAVKEVIIETMKKENR